MKLRTLSLLAALICVSLSSPVCAPVMAQSAADPAPLTLHVSIVVSVMGQGPCFGAKVEVHEPGKHGKMLATGQANRSGIFQTDLAAGAYDLIAEQGDAYTTKTIHVDADHLTFKMDLPPPEMMN